MHFVFVEDLDDIACASEIQHLEGVSAWSKDFSRDFDGLVKCDYGLLITLTGADFRDENETQRRDHN
jgi:hypothetical protein